MKIVGAFKHSVKLAAVHVRGFNGKPLQFLKRRRKEIRYKRVNLVRLTDNMHIAVTGFFVFGNSFADLGGGFYACNRSSYVVRKLRDKLFFALVRPCLGYSGFFQLASHYVKAFGKRPENILPVHFQRNVKISARHAPCKAFQLPERLYDRTVKIYKIYYAQRALNNHCG